MYSCSKDTQSHHYYEFNEYTHIKNKKQIVTLEKVTFVKKNSM